MNIEKDIPDYAMVPAKQIEEKKLEPITSDAIYTPIEVTDVLEGQKITFVIEEDILVPDTKPDLKDILIMEGSCYLTNREISSSTKDDEYTTLSGELCLESLYCPEKPSAICPIISIETRIPFKEQCKPGKAEKTEPNKGANNNKAQKADKLSQKNNKNNGTTDWTISLSDIASALAKIIKALNVARFN